MFPKNKNAGRVGKQLLTFFEIDSERTPGVAEGRQVTMDKSVYD